jgi:hypothetical protein
MEVNEENGFNIFEASYSAVANGQTSIGTLDTNHPVFYISQCDDTLHTWLSWQYPSTRAPADYSELFNVTNGVATSSCTLKYL